MTHTDAQTLLRSRPAPPTQGARGEPVRQLQLALVLLGHKPGPVDGIWGPQSLRAWVSWLASEAPSPTPAPELPAHVARVLAEAERDWRNKDSIETVQRPDGPVSRIFRDSGWSNIIDVRSGRVSDWCGMAVAAWSFRAGMAPILRNDLWSTANVRSSLSYRRAGNVHHRTEQEVQPPGTNDWLDVEAWHTSEGQRRAWVEGNALHAIPIERWDIRPGDILLIAHNGSRTSAQHITMVRAWDPSTLSLQTIEGNASGLDPDGKRRRQGVVVVNRALSDPQVARTIFGVGRHSPLDFTPGLQFR